MAFTDCLKFATDRFKLSYSLKDKQRLALEKIYEGGDVMCLLPTGYGKSIIYQLTPFLLLEKLGLSPCETDYIDNQQLPITLIISPLNSIMQNQVESLSHRGIAACAIDVHCTGTSTYAKDSSDHEDSDTETPDSDNYIKTSVDLEDVKDGKFNLMFSHPEALLSTKAGKKMIRSPLFQKRVCCIAVNEAHMVQEWGEDFRKDFSKLDDLIALFPRCPHVVVTATASATTQQHICKTLQLRNVCHVTVNPDRPNIKYSKIKRTPSNEDGLDSLLEKLVEELKQDVMKFPLTLVYTDLESVQYCYSFMSHAL